MNIALYYNLKNFPHKGFAAYAEIVPVNGHYIVSQFRIPGENGGWDLMKNKYSTLEGVLRAARKKGIFVSTNGKRELF